MNAIPIGKALYQLEVQKLERELEAAKLQVKALEERLVLTDLEQMSQRLERSTYENMYCSIHNAIRKFDGEPTDMKTLAHILTEAIRAALWNAS